MEELTEEWIDDIVIRGRRLCEKVLEPDGILTEEDIEEIKLKMRAACKKDDSDFIWFAMPDKPGSYTQSIRDYYQDTLIWIGENKGSRLKDALDFIKMDELRVQIVLSQLTTNPTRPSYQGIFISRTKGKEGKFFVLK